MGVVKGRLPLSAFQRPGPEPQGIAGPLLVGLLGFPRLSLISVS
ncbi:hypothetical protein ACH4MM_17160 [Streptomyces pratensis]